MIRNSTRIAVVLGAAIALAGCNAQKMYSVGNDRLRFEDPQKAYPIEVVDGANRITVHPARSGRLSARDEKRVRQFAAEVAAIPEPVTVSRPRGSIKAELAAARITVLLKEHGVAPQRIRHVERRSRKGGIVISMPRKIAVTRECGDWTKSITETGGNLPYRNFGCAQQHNLAAMVANPEDFERPRPMTPPSAKNRALTMDRYVKKEPVSSASEPLLNDGMKN